jgi:hypothetical protein
MGYLVAAATYLRFATVHQASVSVGRRGHLSTAPPPVLVFSLLVFLPFGLLVRAVGAPAIKISEW